MTTMQETTLDLTMLRSEWLERQAAAKQHYADGNMDRREDALNELYALEAQMFAAIRDRGFSASDAEEVLRLMSFIGLDVETAMQAVIDENRDRDVQGMQRNLAHGF